MSEDANGTTTVPSTYERLSVRFPAAAHKTKPGSNGKTLTYVDGEMVISRLNEVLGFGWSFRVMNQGTTDAEAWVLGELSATIDGVSVVRQQYGAQELTRGTRAVTDLYKSAATDAIKKCATTLGIALYLYDADERNEVEAEMREAKRPKAQTGNAATSAASPTTQASRSADTRSTTPAAPSSSSTTATPVRSTPKVEAAAVVGGADPTVLKTKAELAADLRKGLEYARSLGLDVEDVDPAPLNRAQIEETINSLRQMCREVLAEQRRQGMVV